MSPFIAAIFLLLAGAAPAATATPKPDIDAELVESPRPSLYEISKGCTQLGVFTLSVTVGVDGKVTSARIARTSGCSSADKAVLAYVRGWHYKPAVLYGKPVVQVVRTTLAI
jgi:protein TonB